MGNGIKFFIFILCSSFLICCNSKSPDDYDEKYFTAIASNNIQLRQPKEGEWLYTHKETGQPFSQYQNANPVRPTSKKSVIYIQPLGTFNELQYKALELTRQYTEIFFQLKTELLPSISDAKIPETAKRKTDNNGVQLLAPFIIDSMLKKNIPDSAIAVLAISEKDLYPKEDWNYVFGLASYHDRVGVSSIYRLENKKLDTANFTLCVRRLINVSAHEIGHMFSLKHCVHAKCVMNGSNSLAETDATPNRLCSLCQRKLHWAIGYNNKTRAEELVDFLCKNKLNYDCSLIQQDISVVE